MGKKSKKKSGKQKGGGKFSSNSTKRCDGNKSSSSSAAKAPASATCWVCLEEDSSDEPLTRDCSCRGDSGWAHLECLVGWCKHASDDHFDVSLWQNCNCCKQKHANRVLLGLSHKATSYLAEKYPGREEKTLPGLNMILDAVMLMQHAGNADKDIADQGMAAAEEIISIAGDVRPESQLSHIFLAAVEESKGTRDGRKLAIGHWEKVKVCCGQDAYSKKTADFKIAELKSELGEELEENVDGNSWLRNEDDLERQYHDSVRKGGVDSSNALATGMALATSYKDAGRVIEAQRLLTEIVSRSRRVLGPDHELTKKMERNLTKEVSRRSVLVADDSSEPYIAVSYDESKEMYTLKGPCESPPNEEQERIHTVPRKKVVMLPNTPVICEGLKSAAHLNGKMGDARAYKKETGRHEVHFVDDKNLKPAYVKTENLIIAFKIPPLPSYNDQKASKTGDASSGNKIEANWFGETDMLEKKYHDSLRAKGADSFDAIQDGNLLAMTLIANGRGVEAQRILADNLCRSRRVLGPGHQSTLETEQFLKRARTRTAGIIGERFAGHYEVLGYDEDAGTYTVKGPVLDPRREGEEDTRTVPMKSLLLVRGSPVICEGLKNSSHMNGKLGDAKKYDHRTGRYEVSFEDKNLKPASVKKENLRIAFDFPPPMSERQ